MFCKKCGSEIADGTSFCSKCGANASADSPDTKNTTQVNSKFLGKCQASFIIGLVGSMMALMGSLCTAACAFTKSGGSLLIMLLGSIVGIIGAALCLSKAKLGSLLQIASAIMVAIGVYSPGGADLLSVLSWIILLVSGIVGVIITYLINKDQPL